MNRSKRSTAESFSYTVRAQRGRLSALSVFLCKFVLYGVFVWARRALNSRKRWFPARAEEPVDVPVWDGEIPRDELEASLDEGLLSFSLARSNLYAESLCG